MLKFIKDLAGAAGELAMKRRKTLSAGAIHEKSTKTDLVTDIDREVENFIIAELRKKTPDYAILGEETGFSGNSPWCWVIDPIDGTTAFIHGLPTYSVSIALEYQGVGRYGAVFAPRLGELFAAEKGHGAELNGESIRVSGCTEFTKAMLGVGFGCIRAGIRPDNMDYLPDLVRKCRGICRTGSAALDMSYLASGRFDMLYNLVLARYDIAAGRVICLEAGAKITDLHGGDEYPAKGMAAANPVMHRMLLDYLQTKEAELTKRG